MSERIRTASRKREIAKMRAELEALEREHNARIKDAQATPEEHLDSALKISNLRAELRELERPR